jgi:hypothetical protein
MQGQATRFCRTVHGARRDRYISRSRTGRNEDCVCPFSGRSRYHDNPPKGAVDPSIAGRSTLDERDIRKFGFAFEVVEHECNWKQEDVGHDETIDAIIKGVEPGNEDSHSTSSSSVVVTGPSSVVVAGPSREGKERALPTRSSSRTRRGTHAIAEAGDNDGNTRHALDLFENDEVISPSYLLDIDGKRAKAEAITLKAKPLPVSIANTVTTLS